MNTVVLEAPGQLALRERPAPGAPGAGEARVRILRVGVCGTDLHAYRGRQAFVRYPLVLGHEIAAEVVALGADVERAGAPAAAPVRVGDRCIVIPYVADGTCQACRAGRTNCCTKLSLYGVHTDGAMCDEMVVPVGQLLPANDLRADVLAVCEMLAVGAHATARARLDARARVLVIGAGPIGLSTLAFARLEAAATFVIDLDEGRSAHAEAAGLAHAIRPAGGASAAGDTVEPWVDALRDALGGDLPEVVFDATGSRASMERAPALVAPGGRLVLVGHTPGPLTFANPVLHGKELELVASRNAQRVDFDTVLEALRRGRVDPLPWITARVGPAEFVAAIDGWSQPGSDVVKAIVVWPPLPADVGGAGHRDAAGVGGTQGPA